MKRPRMRTEQGTPVPIPLVGDLPCWAAVTAALQRFVAEHPDPVNPGLSVPLSVLEQALMDAESALVRGVSSGDAAALLEYCRSVINVDTLKAAKAVAKPECLAAPGNGHPLPTAVAEARQLAGQYLYLLAAIRSHADKDVKRLLRVQGLAWTKAPLLKAPLLVSTPCDQCGHDATLSLQGLTSDALARLSCDHCGHQVRQGDARRCACSGCVGGKQALVEALRTAIGRVNDEIRDWHARQQPVAEAARRAYEVVMERAAALHANDLSARLRQVLSLAPRDYDDFLKLTEDVARKRSPTTSAWSIQDEAERAGVVVRAPYLPLLADDPLGALVTSDSRPWLRIVKGGSIGGAEISADQKSAVLRSLMESEAAANCLHIVAAGIVFMPTLEGHPLPEAQSFAMGVHGPVGATPLAETRVVPCAAGWRYELNPHWLSGHASGARVVQTQSNASKKLFSSATEIRAFQRLLAENPASIVVPNYPVARVLDLKNISSQLDSWDRQYLHTAIFDFAVYGHDGSVLFAEEIQRGDHHNDPEWIRKDAAKRRACALAGVEFRESF